MHTLDKRISALEQASPAGCMMSTIIVVPMLKRGNPVLESIRDNHGNAWNLRPNETQADFEDRAASETPRKDNQVVMLVGSLATAES